MEASVRDRDGGALSGDARCSLPLQLIQKPTEALQTTDEIGVEVRGAVFSRAFEDDPGAVLVACAEPGDAQ